MDDMISRIDPDKRDRIIRAAIEEFALSSYDKASTNNIVKRAGISKGLLFHYFGSKKELYEAVTEFVIRTLCREIAEKIDWEESDLIERIKQIAVIKLDYSRRYPYMFDFLLKVLAYENAGTVNDMMDFYKGYELDFRQITEDLYTKNVDYSKFRNPSAIPESVKIVRWALEKFGEEKLSSLGADKKLDLAEAVDGLNHYMDILREAFYKVKS